MKFSEYLSVHYSLFQAIILQIGLLCPLRCKHCSVFAGPSRSQIMHSDLARRLISDFATQPDARLVVLTGGEPFAIAETLDASLEECHRRRLESYVITSAHWASTTQDAVELVASKPPISLLMVSADEYHEEYVPLEFVRNALEACIILDRDAVLSVAVHSHNDSYLDRVRAVVGKELLKAVEIEITRIQPTGRARVNRIGSFDTQPQRLPPGACDLVGTPVFVYNGKAAACCQIDSVNELAFGKETPYQVGTEGEGISAIRQRIDTDPFWQALRVWGPSELVRLLESKGVDVTSLQQAYDGICFLCRDLRGNSKILSQLQDILSSTEIRNEIRLSRILQYGEFRPCPSTIPHQAR